MKICKVCKQIKANSEFYTIGKYFKPSCKPCEKLEKANWYKQNKVLAKAQSSAYQKKNRKARTAYTKAWRLANVYNITQEQYEQLLLKQENKCAICTKHRDELDRELCVDHDHVTNKVRGLLCYHCNVALGYLKDSITTLLSAAKYLEIANASSVN